MDADAKRAIEWDCQQVLTRFINRLDARDYPALAKLFTADGQWFRPGGPARGPEGILAALQARPESGDLAIRHVISNIVVDVIDQDHAEAVTYLTVYRHEGARNGATPVPLTGPYMVGLSTNKLVRTADGWRIGEKRTTRIFERIAS
jgi:ketosteroid isomerase-like protein